MCVDVCLMCVDVCGCVCECMLMYVDQCVCLLDVCGWVCGWMDVLVGCVWMNVSVSVDVFVGLCRCM